MVVTSKQDIRDGFAGRLRQCVDQHPNAPEGRGRPAWLAKEVHVSGEMARKWLAGEALPTPARADGLAEFFRVRRAWLRDGEGPMRAGSGEHPADANRIGEVRSVTAYGVTVTEPGLLFAAEWEKLDSDARWHVEALVGMLVGKGVRDAMENRRRAPTEAQIGRSSDQASNSDSKSASARQERPKPPKH